MIFVLFEYAALGTPRLAYAPGAHACELSRGWYEVLVGEGFDLAPLIDLEGKTVLLLRCPGCGAQFGRALDPATDRLEF